jgi:hypothetical protein
VRLLTLCFLAPLLLVADDTLPKAFTDPPTVRQGRYVLWHDPGAVETLDFQNGIGGPEMAPAPPFQFVEDDNSGTTPKIKVKDAKDHTWVVKLGREASSDTFCTRLAWALGYYVEPEYFVAEGVIQGAHNHVDAGGHFQNARFQLRSREPKYVGVAKWSWTDNPFVGTPEFNGLRVLMMLLSNWDDKDARDYDKRGSNTAIYQQGDLLIYFIDDWGGALGSWGKYFTRSKWNAKNFRDQSAHFVELKNGNIHWGYTGQHSSFMNNDVKPGDIAWLMQYLGRVTDDQLRTGLLSSGATEDQARDYLEGLRKRIDQLKRISAPTAGN